MNPPDLADMLAEVNRLRAERGMDALEEMPKGERNSAFTCPLAKACGEFGSASQASLWFDGPGGTDRPRPSSLLRDFLKAFDNGRYPELVA